MRKTIQVSFAVRTKVEHTLEAPTKNTITNVLKWGNTISSSVYRRSSVQLTAGRVEGTGRGRSQSYDGEKACYSINH
jgi:hypothetical protein